MPNPVHDQPEVATAESESERWHAPMDGKRVSLEEYWERWYEDEGHYEWNNGILEAKPMPTAEEYNLYVWFVQLLDHYLRPKTDYQMIGLETGFELTIPDHEAPGTEKTVVRKPDIGIITPDNSIRMEKNDRTYHGTLDICIECISDSSKRMVERDTLVKKQEYSVGKVREYYILDPEAEADQTHAQFFRITKQGEFVEITPDQNGTIHSVEMPGFRFRAEHLANRPSIEDLIDDPVYDYVLPNLREKHKEEIAEKEEAIAEKEEAIAEKDEAIAEKDETINRLKEELELLRRKSSG